LDELLVLKNESTEERKEWMNTPTFIDYEINYLNHCRKAIAEELKEAEFDEDCYRNILNRKCPLCRA
jgi:hypothetical protein